MNSTVILDAGTGICALGQHSPADVDRVDPLLTHLHVDHILGLGFIAALYWPDLEIHI
jgi:phosphoribosyl 1,2-cyclic phosphodiesterase